MDSRLATDWDFNTTLPILARYAYISSLFYLAAIGEPSGLYPHSEHAADLGRDADRTAADLVRFAIWEPVAFGYHVRSYCGWAVTSERRAALPASTREHVYARDGRACVRCASTDHLSLDHITPWSLGGADTADNLQTLCRSCNSRKGARI